MMMTLAQGMQVFGIVHARLQIKPRTCSPGQALTPFFPSMIRKRAGRWHLAGA